MNPMLAVVAESQGGVFSRGQALACGYTPRGIRDRVRSGRWLRVRYGQYAEAVDLSRLAPWDQELSRYRQLVYAVMNAMRPGSVAISHQSSLLLHGLPLWGVDLSQVHLTRLDERRHSGPVADVRYHRGSLASDDLAMIGGQTTTALPRSVVESACTASFEAAVVFADAALRDHAIDGQELLRLLQLTEFWPGSATARAALSFADGRSESVGESRFRVLMHNQGLPVPELQVVYRDRHGIIGRVDFDFSGRNTVVEFDGRLKYADASSDVLVQEKIREDRLRGIGLEVVRMMWPDLNRPADAAATIRAAFARARRAA
ncbi:type IV toxin-antitoxin system AbiEi family antitoxin domain-containing protein [Kribbella sp. NBC_00709]|uniref:type IV toxin-antitoxin system AbiEi family antitoxin domain-containing protein n=1 Tax=Kribbella sp. NBC_00709 TaxID=2975972 RepID=UPI002E2A9868|nr:type IV toxin-antitoxin system AbiEi family antitoxin domain-containing protein [Kribbella sp. NBC_00709]